MSEAERTTKAETLERRLNELRLVATEWARMDFPAADAEVARRISSVLRGISERKVKFLLEQYGQICEVAKMAAQGMSGKQIAAAMGKTEPAVSILRSLAIELKVLQTVVDKGAIPAAQPIDHELSYDLAQRLGMRITVYVTPPREPSEGEDHYWSRRIRTFADCAASRVTRRVLESRKLGVAWGTTVSSVVEAICQQRAWRDRSLPLTAIPLAGEMVGSDARESRSCSALADKLVSAIVKRGSALSLRGVPPFISTKTREADAKAVKRYFHNLDPVREVARASTELDAALTSVGTHDQPNKLYTQELTQSGVSAEILHTLSCGDIGGVLLEMPGLTMANRSRFTRIKQNWLGMSEETFRSCAARAQASQCPGVLVVALGGNKAPVLQKCIAEGLVTECFLDDELGKELLKRV